MTKLEQCLACRCTLLRSGLAAAARAGLAAAATCVGHTAAAAEPPRLERAAGLHLEGERRRPVAEGADHNVPNARLRQ